MGTKNKYIFPQAEDIKKLLSLLLLLENDIHSNTLLSQKLELTTRNVDYYKSALLFLGLIEGDCQISNLGVSILKDQQNGCSILKEIILNIKVFNDYYLSLETIPLTRDQIKKRILSEYSIGEKTAIRRVSSVISWCKWCREIIE